MRIETTTKIILTEEEEEALLEVCDIISDIKSNLSNNKALFPYLNADVDMLISHCEEMTRDLDLILDDADKIISFESDRKEV